jgi:PAP2 superfamily
MTDAFDRSDHSMITRRRFLRTLGGVAGVVTGATALSPAVALDRASSASADRFDAEVPTAWFDLASQLIRTTGGFSPPVASRALGYAGIALYEAVVPGMPGFQSLEGQLDGLSGVLRERDREDLHWPIVANAALAGILRSLFPTTSAENIAALDALESSFNDRFSRLDRAVWKRSQRRGTAVAEAIFDWSRDDGGDQGELRNFPADYAPPVGPGLWQPTPPGFMRALQPFWGANRTFVVSTDAACEPGGPTPYSENPSSAFWAEAFEVYDTVNNLTDEQRAIALFWADDPGATATPPGHSISIATQVLRQMGAGLDIAAETYAKVGMALADAFIACWDTKYRYNLLRPVTYIQRLIDASWLPLLGTPPFPEYTSGHSVQSGAAAEVLTDLFGPDLAFVDRTHESRGLPPRAFNSFFEAAAEAAISRLYGGIHFRPAIVRGLDQGRCVGRAVNELEFRRGRRSRRSHRRE